MKPLSFRKDAVENRAALMKAAAEVFAEQGLDAPLEAIADRATVGRATLYRNFPDRASLALAVLLEEVQELSARIGDQGDRPDLFFWFLDELTELMIRNAGLAGLLRDVRTPEDMEPLRQALIQAGTEPLVRAQAAGLVRQDVTPSDIRVLAGMLGAGLHGADETERRAVSRRARSLIMNGLRSRP